MGDDNLARRAALLAVLAPSAPSALSTPTPEPFFSVLALVGLWCLSARPATPWHMAGAALAFAGATLFRANGVLLGGYLVWHGVWYEAARRRGVRAVLAALWGLALAALAALPFVLHQVWAHARLCPGAAWCTSPVPLAYSYVQSHYWDVGVLRYWEAAQLPNFVLAAPVLAAGAYACWAVAPPWRASLVALAAPLRRAARPGDVRVPLVLHTAATLAVLLFASHVQIALRFATPGGLPLVYMGAARLLSTRYAPYVVAYAVLYNVVGGVLYAGFYPPA